MNTYNDNLRNTVVASLQAQELGKITLEGDLNASLFTLYYAEGATVTAEEKLALDTQLQAEKKKVMKQAVNNNNLSVNMLASATQANTYLQQSVTNTAVCAANVQVAANAIVTLAGDVGSIYSIINAGDYDTDMYKLVHTTRDLMNDTAYSAEVASKTSMETAIYTSEVTSQVILAKAKSVNTAVGNLLTTATSEYNTVSQIVNDDHNNISATSATEKVAEGNLEDINVETIATARAYTNSNNLLNQGLTVKNQQETSFDVSFDLIRIPFTGVAANQANHDIDKQKMELMPYYPVNEYFFIVVKNSKSYTFSLSDAEGLYSNGNKKICIPVNMDVVTTRSIVHYNQKGDEKDELIRTVSNTLDIAHIKDSDGETIVLGTEYVTFVFATYELIYKKMLNNFEDYLSAPSYLFTLTHKMEAVKNSSIKWGKIGSTNVPELPKNSETKGDTYELTFTVKKDSVYSDAAYRLIFLPEGDELARNLLTFKSLDKLESDVELLEKVADNYNPKISELETKLTVLQTKIDKAKGAERDKLIIELVDAEAELSALIQAKAEASASIGNETLLKLEEEEAKLMDSLSGLLKPKLSEKEKIRINKEANAAYLSIVDSVNNVVEFAVTNWNTHATKQSIQAILKIIKDLGHIKWDELTLVFGDSDPKAKFKLEKEVFGYLSDLNSNVKRLLRWNKPNTSGKEKIGFVFNETIARQVPAGNYTTTTRIKVENVQPTGGTAYQLETWVATFGTETTDNFGNALMDKGKYVPAILSTAGPTEENQNEITDTLSDFESMRTFTYHSY